MRTMQDAIDKKQQDDIWQWQNVHDWHNEQINKSTATTSLNKLRKLRQRVLCCEEVLVSMLYNEFNLPLKLQLLDQTPKKCNVIAAQLLAINATDTCWRRRVRLNHANKDLESCLFNAESWLPQRYIANNLLADLQSGNIPLGRLLQGDMLKLQRHNLAIGYNELTGCWGRRSLLYADCGAKALVYEFFSPIFWQCLQE
ncbi:MAG: hypothetical protein R8L53_03100 [Mariprofundales bacterium]